MEERLESLRSSVKGERRYIDRFYHEIRFSLGLCEARPEKGKEWRPLIEKAVQYVESSLKEGKSDLKSLVEEAEKILEPIGKAAKEYTIYCVGHAHIDMNWMWPWPETVSVINDTFSTVDKLMDEFPEFRFSQSQASTYMALKEYLPELYERVKKRFREGRWEITASTWVEGDENLSSGEMICRHLLYTKRFISQEFGVPVDAVKIDWEPDLFGHPHTMPSFLARAGVKRYYFCRGGKGHKLFWWQGPDGSRVLAYDDSELWYIGHMNPADKTPMGGPTGGDIISALFKFEKETGLKDYLFVYGVGDHGGGPTRRDLMNAIEINSWPIFPNVRFSTTEEYFSIIEPKLPDDLTVVEDELNFVFRGCYTSQSNIKRANRYSENRLFEAEVAAVIGFRLLGLPYPEEDLAIAWRNALFNQFHDILPGSGSHATYEYSQGLFQEILARTGMIKTRILRSLASRVDTTGMDGPSGSLGDNIGAGAGNESALGKVSSIGSGAVSLDPFIIFNPNPWERDELVAVKVWDKELPADRVKVTSPSGEEMPCQVIEQGGYWGHRFTTLLFPVRKLPPVGYRVYAVGLSESPLKAEPMVKVEEPNAIENEFLRLEVDPDSGAISSLVDKRTGYDLVPEGGRLGLLRWLLEEPHGMTAWEIGRIAEQVDLADGATVEIVHRGPYLGLIRAHHKHNESRFTTEISLKAGVPWVEFRLVIDWLEIGKPDYGVPMLRMLFPLAISNGRARFEIPCGHIERPANGEEVPALRWADLTGERVDGRGKAGVTLLNDYKYGHSATENELALTLIRSSYDPDPLPELGHHEIRLALLPHGEDWTPSRATRAGYDFNRPVEVVATDVHEGDLPKERGFIAVHPSNIFISGLKKAEEGNGLVIRLYETEGRTTEAEIRIDPSLAETDSEVVELDLLERPIRKERAKMEEGLLKVQVPSFGITTVMIGR